MALEDAIFLARGLRQVYLIHRRGEFRRAKSLQEKVFSLPNVKLLKNTVVTSIEGENAVTGVKLKAVENDREESLSLDGVFIAVGAAPETEAYEGLLELSEDGYICAGEDGITSVPGIFAAGDIRTKSLRQIVTAVSDGANAAVSAERYLGRH